MADESKYPTRIAPYGLRMPDDLKARVQAAAEANNRSMNAEIVATLEEKYPAPVTKSAIQALYDLLELFDSWNPPPEIKAQFDEVKADIAVSQGDVAEAKSIAFLKEVFEIVREVKDPIPPEPPQKNCR